MVMLPGALEPIEFECFDNWLSEWVCREILIGHTYPTLPVVDDVRVVFDVGANCGAAAVYFAAAYPGAQIHAFEPAAEPFRRLGRNAARSPNIATHNVGLHSHDQRVPLYAGAIDSVTGSIYARDTKNATTSETVTLRSFSGWLDEHGISEIDVLKVDVEGSEVDVLESLGDRLRAVKVVYVEYDSSDARRQIDRLFEGTHELCFGEMFLTQGEAIYVSKDITDDPAAERTLFQFFWEHVVRLRTASSGEHDRDAPPAV